MVKSPAKNRIIDTHSSAVSTAPKEEWFPVEENQY